MCTTLRRAAHIKQQYEFITHEPSPILHPIAYSVFLLIQLWKTLNSFPLDINIMVQWPTYKHSTLLLLVSRHSILQIRMLSSSMFEFFIFQVLDHIQYYTIRFMWEQKHQFFPPLEEPLAEYLDMSYQTKVLQLW